MALHYQISQVYKERHLLLNIIYQQCYAELPKGERISSIFSDCFFGIDFYIYFT